MDGGHRRGTEALALVRREVRLARLERGLSQAAVGTALGVDGSWISRIERGELEDLGLVAASELLAAVGLDLSIRAYPGGRALRDAAHAALLERLHAAAASRASAGRPRCRCRSPATSGRGTP